MKHTILYTTLFLVALFGATMYFSACKQDICVVRATDCRNGGTCVDGECLCALGYEGDSCQFKVNAKFDSYYACIRTRLINSSTVSEDNDDTLRVHALSDRFSIKFYSVRDSVFEIVKGTVNGNYVTIQNQDINFPTYTATYSGNGSLNNGVLTLTLYKTWFDGVVNTSKTSYVGYKYE
ncbi:MAG: calcium-binding EGF-like domain-containing protein [Bacteroidetes bacterium]|nr:calcium-binding EGF-like domain-containing protein [Bacteroidota bacterium]